MRRFVAHFSHVKMIILPRQAPDERRESTQKQLRLLMQGEQASWQRTGRALLPAEGGERQRCGNASSDVSFFPSKLIICQDRLGTDAMKR